ncbi:uncharacterized protein QC763_0076720 [Podospora pseudopauciseta]|uniref:Uncharacterized protein n=1 Tax=Podospora pseudopauciseta TaxID=2093780 RepID=A0ABR0HAW2_9PEZI|nr:hypothetical protein QC763_0076720 [Podospora pseudopauciseta]
MRRQKVNQHCSQLVNIFLDIFFYSPNLLSPRSTVRVPNDTAEPLAGVPVFGSGTSFRSRLDGSAPTLAFGCISFMMRRLTGTYEGSRTMGATA